MRRDEVTLLDIAQAARLVIEFTQGMTKEQFFEDIKTQSAVLYQLLVMGEAVKRLSREFRARHPHIPWSLIVGMRDHLIHGYDIVDWDEVWKTTKKDIPDLLGEINSLLPSEPTNSY
ncbi:DUF86 domain-containing protein [Candidatus Poribacteria bacterium]|nr:DUF86 domain-containing protein [Candidatus Poribacteria bacterium]